MTTGEDLNPLSTRKLNWKTIAGIVVVSAVYFADIFLKASHKCFWFDELFTVFLCRLPNFRATWTAVTHGADFNPPLFYLLTRGAQRVFGEGLIATRLPAMVGVWLFSVCLFLFVARRAGVVSGFIAGVFPFFTLIQYYAYEARAHGLVLGWCGAALVCWQRTEEGNAKQLWLAGFGLSLVGALLTHVYAVYLLVPFALVELYNFVDRRRPNWLIVAVIVFAFLSVTLTVYFPLSRIYRSIMPPTFFSASHDLIQHFLLNAIGPAVIILLLWLVLSALGGMRSGERRNRSLIIPRREMLVAAGFVCFPILGLIGSKVSHGPFVDRYFLSSIAGYAIFLGFVSSGIQSGPWVARALAGSMFLLMLADLGATMYLGWKNRIVLFEPSTSFRVSTTPSNPMLLYETFSTHDAGADILVLPSLDYLYLFNYAPPAVVSHLYYGAPINGVNRGGYERLAKWAHIDLKTITVEQFLATHERFLVYENGITPHADEVQTIARAGYKLISARGDAVGIMYEYSR